jgi:alkylation response protein AidB-like acyl-CoA dehydrogenase
VTIQFLPTDEQTMLREGLRRWGRERDVRETEEFAPIWRFAVEQGWLMAGMPEELGGLGGGAFDMAIIAEELGRVLVRASFVEIGIVAATLLAELSPDDIPAILMGEAFPLLAHDEAGARGDRDWVETVAVEQGGLWALTGRKTGLIGAMHADTLIVSARIPDGGVALFRLPAADAPLRIFTTFDGRSGGEVRLDATPAALLAEPVAAGPALARALDYGLILEAAETLGAMEHALEMTRDYLLTRQQYGQFLAEFQALRHRVADMYIETEQARSILLRGVAALSEDDVQQRATMAAAVKARVAQAALFVCGNAIQLHGGIGVTDEYPVGHFFKRALAFDQRHGGGARQVERYAELAIG